MFFNISIMKFFSILLIISAIPFLSVAQHNISSQTVTYHCSHLKSALDHQKQYHSPISNHPLLTAYDVHFYFLDITAENNSVDISGNVTIKSTVIAWELDTFAFELISDLVIDSVFVNDIGHSFSHIGDIGLVPINKPIPSGEILTVQVYYHGTPPSGGFFRGISTAYNDTYDKHVTWTLSEPYAAKEWFPVKQDLSDKADSVWVFVTTDSTNMVGSQGLLTNITELPGGKLRYEWKSRYPIAYYLISISISDYQEYNIWAHPSNMEDSVLIQNFIYDHPSYLLHWKDGIDNTVDFLELFSEIYGPYPFADEKYGHCVSEIGGGMEHQTMTTLGGFNYGLVAHELGHMWFGDRLTCATWNDIWVNEGFATYSDYLAHHFLSTPYYDSVWLKIRHDHVKSESGGSVYVPDSLLEDVWRIFDGRLSYSKGALLLHMIRFELQDDDLFFEIMTGFGIRYSDSVATAMDFKELVEEMSGRDFDFFFDQWYFGEGFPIYDIVWNQQNDTLHIFSTQTASTSATTFFHMLVPYQVTFLDGSDTTLNLVQDKPMTEYALPLHKTISGLKLDPDQWIIHELNSISNGLENHESPVFFTFGPNPARDLIHIYFRYDACINCKLYIADLTGRILFTGEFFAGHQVIDLTGLTGGSYLITVSDGLNAMTRQVMKVEGR
jgi:aminopeptidase N